MAKASVSPILTKDGTWGISKSFSFLNAQEEIEFDDRTVVAGGLTKSGAYALCHTMACSGKVKVIIPTRLDRNLKVICDAYRD